MDQEIAPGDHTQDEHRPHAGRPRSASADAGIVDAAVSLLGEVGYRAMSMEGVAARAGVSKATLYRRYPDKEALVVGVLARSGGLPPGGPGPGGPGPFGPGPFGGPGGPPPFPGLGREQSARDMLSFSLRMAARAAADPSWLPVLGAMLVEGNHSGGLADAVRTRIFEPSSAAVRAIVEAGVASGAMRSGGFGAVIGDIMFGALVARSMLREPITDEWIDGVIETLWQGMGAEPRASGDPDGAARASPGEARAAETVETATSDPPSVPTSSC